MESSCPLVFADTVSGAILSNGLLRLTLAVETAPREGESARTQRPTAELVLPLQGAMTFHGFLTRLMGELERQGVVVKTDGTGDGGPVTQLR